MEQNPAREANSHTAHEKCPAFYGTQRFIITFKTANHWSLFWARYIQSTPTDAIAPRQKDNTRMVSSLQIF